MMALPMERQAQIAAIAAEANAAGRSISVQQKPCVRRFEIARALVLWAENNGNEDELCSRVIGLVAHSSRIPLDDTIGGWISVLTIEQATALADAFDHADVA